MPPPPPHKKKCDLSHLHLGFSKWFVPFPLDTIQFQFLPLWQQIGTHKNYRKKMCELMKRFCVCDATKNYNIDIHKRTACIIYICSQLTPYLGKQLDGCVIYTILRGHIVYQNGKFTPPLGQLVLPSSLQNWWKSWKRMPHYTLFALRNKITILDVPWK